MTVILIIDDDSNIVELYSAFIKAEGKTSWQIKGIDQVEKAIDFIKSTPPDIIFLDNKIPPQTDFRQPLADIKATGFTGPVIIQSAATELDIFDQAEALGAAMVMDKWQVHSETLVELIEKLT